MKIVLASNSEIRRKIASTCSSDIVFTSPKINEEQLKEQLGDLAPNKLCYELAKAKALSIPDYQDHIILGCDQICVLENKIYSKPLNSQAAFNQLMELSNKTHFLIGSYVFCKNNKIIQKEQVKSEMEMRSLEKYLACLNSEKCFHVPTLLLLTFCAARSVGAADPWSTRITAFLCCD